MGRLSLFLLILGLVSHVYSETCPPDEELYPCTCEEEDDDILVTCSDDSLNLLNLKKALNSLSSKRDVDLVLSDLELGTVPSDFFNGIGIKRLDISHCEMDTLSDDGRSPLLGLETTLEELTVFASFTENNVPAVLKIGHLKSLKRLDLAHNIITEMGDDFFGDPPASLEYLTISNNGIEIIGDNAFARFVNLKEFSLDGNRFGPIKRSMFPNPANNLETLAFDNNALTDIPEDTFEGMPLLSSISFRMNGIVRLEERTWSRVWQQLDVIYLEGNSIECTAHMNWIFQLRRTAAIYGKCSYPKEYDGQRLQDFIDSRRRNY